MSLWLDPDAVDQTKVCNNARTAVAAATREAALGRDADATSNLVSRRETITHPFYSGE